MEITAATITAEQQFLVHNVDRYVSLINTTRDALGTEFDTDVDHSTSEQFLDAVDIVFTDVDLAVNVAGLMAVLRTLDVPDDHPAFILDDLLGRRLAATIAGGEPRATLAEATFHYVDVTQVTEHGTAGEDDLDAGVVAGMQTRLPGWPWEAAERPFEPARRSDT